MALAQKPPMCKRICCWHCVCVKLFQFHCYFVLRLPPSPAQSSLSVWKFPLCARRATEKFCKFFDLFFITHSVFFLFLLFWLCISSGRQGGEETVGKPLNALRGEAPEMVRQMEWQSSPPQGNPCQAAASLHSFNCQFAIVLVAASSRSNWSSKSSSSGSRTDACQGCGYVASE